jgi:spoIIIJ-associated protein
MSRIINATGSTLEASLAAAVAEIVSCDLEKVVLKVEAPGVDDVAGEHRLTLRIEPVVEPEPAAAVRSEAPAEDPGRQAADPDEEPEASDGGITVEDLEEEADAAADFLEGLLDALDLPGDLRIKVHDDHVELEVIEIGSGALIGRRGQTLEAIQELVRCSLQRQFQRRARVKIDAEGYRSRRLEKLIEKAEEAIDTVLETGDPERLEPMDVFERKAIHQLVAEVDGLESRSQGREPARRVIIEAV